MFVGVGGRSLHCLRFTCLGIGGWSLPNYPLRSPVLPMAPAANLLSTTQYKNPGFPSTHHQIVVGITPSVLMLGLLDVLPVPVTHN